MKKNGSITKYFTYSFILLFALFTNTRPACSEERLETDLQEQQFQPIEAKDEFADNEKDFEFFMPTVTSQKKKTNNINLYSLKNEYFESIKVIIEAKNSELEKATETEVYLNAYEHVKDIPLPLKAKLKVKIFNLYDQYLGYIKTNDDKPDFNIRVSPFLLIPADFDKKNKKIVSNIKEFQKSVDKPLLKEEMQNGKGLIMSQTSTTTTNVAEPITKPENQEIKNQNLVIIDNPQINTVQGLEQVDNQPRKIKIANISDSDIRISIQKPNGDAIGSGWTISNDVYVPQYLNFQSEPINIEPLAKLVISDEKTQKVFSRKAHELNIDERGNYVWFIGSFNELENKQEKNVEH